MNTRNTGIQPKALQPAVLVPASLPCHYQQEPCSSFQVKPHIKFGRKRLEMLEA